MPNRVARSLLLALAAAQCAAQLLAYGGFTRGDGRRLCRLGSAALTAPYQRLEYRDAEAPRLPFAASLSPWQDVTPLHDSSSSAPCEPDAACGAHAQPLFWTDRDRPAPVFHVWCGCAARFFRRAHLGACEPCAPAEVCPPHAVQAFACPAPLRVEDNECVAPPGWRADRHPDVLELGLLVFHQQQRAPDFRVAARVLPCPALMEPADAACVCARGYHAAPADPAQCLLCPRGHFCQQGRKTPCPGTQTTVVAAAGDAAACAPAPAPDAASDTRSAPVGSHARGACGAGATTLTSGAEHRGACFCPASREWAALPHSALGFACLVPPGARGLPAVPLRAVLAPAPVGARPDAFWEAPPPADDERAALGGATLLGVAAVLGPGGGLRLAAHLAEDSGAHRLAEAHAPLPPGLPSEGLAAVALLAAWRPARAEYAAVLLLASSADTALWRVDFALAYDARLGAHALSLPRPPLAAQLQAPADTTVLALVALPAAGAALAVAGARERSFAERASNQTNATATPGNITLLEELAPRYRTLLTCHRPGAVPAPAIELGFDAASRPAAAPLVRLWAGAVCANVTLHGRDVTVRVDTCQVLAAAAAAEACGAGADGAAFEPPARVEILHAGHVFLASALGVHHWRAARAGFVLAQRAAGGSGGLFALLPAAEPERDAQPRDALAACAGAGPCAPAAAGLQRALRALCLPGFAKDAGGGCSGCAPPLNASAGCRLCAPPFFCADGQEHACPAGASTRYHGESARAACVCAAGAYLDRAGACAPCEPGFYCEHGARSPCAPHASTSGPGATRASACVCDDGFEPGPSGCGPGACAAGLLRVGGADGACACPAGSRLRAGACAACAADELCPAGAESAGETCRAELLRTPNRARSACVCRAGYYSPRGGALGECQPCPAGFWCDAPMDLALVACPPGESSPPSAAGASGCFCARRGFLKRRLPDGSHDCACDVPFFRNHSACEPCPPHSHARAVGATRREHCACDEGFYRADAGACAPCPAGSFCSAGRRHACAPGSFGPARRQRSAGACLPCPPGALSAPGAASPAGCADELFALRVGGAFRAFAEQADAGESTWVRARFAAGAAPRLGAAERAADLQARFAALTGGRGALGVLAVSENARGFTVTVQSSPPALADILFALAADPAAWAAIAARARQDRLDTHAALTHAVFCELARAVVREAFAAAAVAAECVTSGLVLPGAPARAALQALAQSTLARVFAVEPAAPQGAPAWDMHPLLAEILRTAAANLRAAGAPAWASADELRGEAMLVAPGAAEARGVLLLVPARAARFARGAPEFAADYARVFGDLALAPCGPAVRWMAGACASAVPQVPPGAPCRFCQAGVAFLRGGACAPCSAGSQCPAVPAGEPPLELSPCCASRDASCSVSAASALLRGGHGLCRDGIHQLGEACDPSSGTPLAACCERNCTLRAGYYAEPACMTYCGDGVVAAPAEECEPGAGGRACSLLTCRFA